MRKLPLISLSTSLPTWDHHQISSTSKLLSQLSTSLTSIAAQLVFRYHLCSLGFLQHPTSHKLILPGLLLSSLNSFPTQKTQCYFKDKTSSNAITFYQCTPLVLVLKVPYSEYDHKGCMTWFHPTFGASLVSWTHWSSFYCSFPHRALAMLFLRQGRLFFRVTQ